MIFAIFSVLIIVALSVLLGCCNAIEVYADLNKLMGKEKNKEE